MLSRGRRPRGVDVDIAPPQVEVGVGVGRAPGVLAADGLAGRLAALPELQVVPSVK